MKAPQQSLLNDHEFPLNRRLRLNGVISKPQLVGYEYVGYQGVFDTGAPGVSP